jgi:hypothetical protein
MLDKTQEERIRELEEMLRAQAVHMDTISRLLLEKSIIDEEDFYTKLRQVQMEYKIKNTISH